MLRRKDAFQHHSPARLTPKMRSAMMTALGIGAAALMVGGGIVPANAGAPALGAASAPAAVDAEDASLAWDTDGYTTIHVTIDGEPTAVRWYKEVCYVADPVLMAAQQLSRGALVTIANPECGYQSMNVFVPESVADDDSTALYFAVNNSGWMASYVGQSVADGGSYDTATSNVGAALAAGYVFINVGTRSRGVIGADESWAGKAPAPVVDAKAAIRYLRLNDEVMPGSAERIVLNGTSGGGGLGSAVGASGNSTDFLPYLAQIGAAGVDAKGRSTLDDDIFAVNIYCPITDLGNADIAYEWLYNVLDTRAAVGEDKWPATSAELAAEFAKYQKSLALRNADGSRLTADTMLEAIEGEVVRSAEAFMAAAPANVISGYDWITVDNDNDSVTGLDMAGYLVFVAQQRQLKPAPSFDQSGVTVPGSGGGPGTGESSLFGTSDLEYSNFTEFGWSNNAIAGDATGTDDTGMAWTRWLQQPNTVVDEQLELIDPMRYIGTRADTAPYWYVRHGALDRDTAFTVSINLDRALEADATVEGVNYRLAWNTNHAGNYDVPEAMQWIAGVLAQADGASGD